MADGTVVSEGVEEAKKVVVENYFATVDFNKLDVSLEGLLKAGVHFGHLKSRRHPKMDEYIYTTRKNINILNLQKTVEKMEAAARFLTGVVKSGKPILFVGMKKQTHDTVKSLAVHVGQYYMIDRWLGGTLTNFECIRGRARHLQDLETKFASGEFKKYTKFEQAKKQEEVERLEKKVGGIKGMENFPGAIVVADTKEAGLVLHEAGKMGVPVVGIVDTNTDPSAVDYPIPANDDALSSLRLLFGYLGKTILTAKSAAAEAKETAKEVKEKVA
ncbi:MAG: 30S ribosomal protein S2 [Candidatus Moranbacteria bacterium]|jgi:small subunit ribosomal protein S2|nr:30S ribosomal protein S2 [Candidatus Moranbacteria bacterium]